LANYKFQTIKFKSAMTNRPNASEPASEDFASRLNASLDGWNSSMGVQFVRATADEVVAQVQVGVPHRQAYGIVHGGLYSGLIETVASVGAALSAMKRGQSVVGLENHTSFLHAVREGLLRATALPLMRGRRTQVWEATIVDADGRTVASGRVRLLSLAPDSSIAGETVAVKSYLSPK
jgi:1,4-dihydroxy-2-naphthoyl-CoA hydrolase